MGSSSQDAGGNIAFDAVMRHVRSLPEVQQGKFDEKALMEYMLQHLHTTKERGGVLDDVIKQIYTNPELKNEYKNVEAFKSFIEDAVQGRLQHMKVTENRSWFGRQWERVKSTVGAIAGNKWVQRAVVVAIIGAAIYLGIRYMPSVDKIKAMMNRMWGVKAAAGKDMITQASASPAAKVVDKLVKTPGGGGAGFPVKLKDVVSPSPMPAVPGAKSPVEFFLNTMRDTATGVNTIKGSK